MTTLHKNPIHFVQVVENALDFIYKKDILIQIHYIKNPYVGMDMEET